MGIEDDTPSWLRGYHDVRVDLHGLRDFATGVDGAADKNFAPRTTQLQGDYASGVCFGWNNPSGEVHAAKMKYHDALTVITKQIEAYIEASKILADAARRAAQRYGDADAMSAAKSQDIAGILGQAVTDAKKRQADQDAAAAAAAAAARHDRRRGFE